MINDTTAALARAIKHAPAKPPDPVDGSRINGRDAAPHEVAVILAAREAAREEARRLLKGTGPSKEEGS